MGSWKLFRKAKQPLAEQKGGLALAAHGAESEPIGLIAGNGSFPFRFVERAHALGHSVIAVGHLGETLPELEQHVDVMTWIKVGELGKLIDTFQAGGVRKVAMAGGINRIKHFGSIKLDVRGAALLLRLRSTKDDVIMRGIAAELMKEGIEVIDCTIYLKECLAREGVLTRAHPTEEELSDIQVGIEAIKAMGSQDIGQLVVIREGVIVAVEAVEGTNAAILRGGELGGKGTVVVKFAKPTQDMRFDVPTIGPATVETLVQAKARVLAVEAGRTLIMDQADVLRLADKNGIAVVGCPPLVR